MTYVVSGACIQCKYTDCVDVCPVDCFVEGANFLAIDPEECVDCNLCVPECPVDAIYAEDEVPEDQQHFIKLNADLATKWPVISSVLDPHPEAEKYAEVEASEKEHLLIKN